MEDYYAKLGVYEHASQDEIKNAYRILARKLHPDTTTLDVFLATSLFNEVVEAYETLNDPLCRRKYDINRNIASHPWGVVRRLLNNLRSRPCRGSDVIIQMPVVLSEIVSLRKIAKTIEYKRKVICKVCNGSGCTLGYRVEGLCKECLGDGYHIDENRACDNCDGMGLDIPNELKCTECSATGFVTEKKSILVTLVRGCKDQDTISFPGYGNAGGNGGPSGNLIVTIDEQQHLVFRRLENDLEITKNISFSDAVLGSEIEIETIYGSLTTYIKIKPGTQSGDIVKITKLGCPIKNSDDMFGDLMVKLHIVTPTQISEKQKKLFKELKEIEGENYDTKENDSVSFCYSAK